MNVRTIQWLLASVFLILGGWCLLAPGSVLQLAIRPAYRSSDPIVPVLIGAFGAQAVLGGLFIGFSRFTSRTFLIYGLALLPFFLFDYYFYAIQPMLTEIGLLDAVGNVAMLLLCWLGWRQCRSAPAP